MSRSSSRAVSISTGSVLVSRIRRQTSSPSRSGSIRSRTTSAGASDWTRLSASATARASSAPRSRPCGGRRRRTRRSPASSSTTRIVCASPAIAVILRRSAASRGLVGNERKRAAVEGVPPVVRAARRRSRGASRGPGRRRRGRRRSRARPPGSSRPTARKRNPLPLYSRAGAAAPLDGCRRDVRAGRLRRGRRRASW